jgi:ABC-type multidrug transport system fused ATPase/permease subunit
MQTLKKILYILTPIERKQGGLLVILVLIMALLDTMGVASILPFMAVISKPDIIQTNIYLNKMFEASSIFGVENNQEFLFVLGIFVFVLLVGSLTFKAFTFYVQARFIQMRQYSISKRLVEGYLQQPYSWFLNRNSADLGKTILTEVSMVVGNGLKPLMELITKGAVTIALVTLLVLVNPKLSLLVGLTFGLFYSFIYKFTRNFLDRIGKESLKNNQLRFIAISEAFGAAKEVKVGRLEQTYIKRYSDPAKTMAQHRASSAVISQLPRFALEAIAFGGIMLMMLYLMRQTGGIVNALPIISLYVFAGYRLMPAMQSIYAALAKLRFVGASLDALVNDIKNLKILKLKKDQSVLSFNKHITLKNIYYNYPNASRTTLKDININIPAKTTVGLVGATGSGKTTIVDIILGLLEAQNGSLEVDGKIIKEQNSKSWQRSIGYVPQHIYLADDTVAANVAFGVDPKDINQEAVEKASKIANLHEFVIEELPKKYQTNIGERGIKLSGGQRQRLGIARALYHNPQLLVLDEATSALDNHTEQAVMDAVNNLNKDITLIIIAHRLNTVKNCDNIFKLEKGELIGQGTYDELINNKKNFRMKNKRV